MRTLLQILRHFERLIAKIFGYGLVFLTKFFKYVYVAELASLIPFRLGNDARYLFYKRTLSRCGEDVTINFGTILSYPEITIGNHCWIGTYNIVGLADLGDYTLTAQGCHIVSGAHTHYFDRTDIPIMKQAGSPSRCSIGPDVWIGAGSVIMANVGRGCVIGAGSVVTKHIPDWSVAAGNPTRVIRQRLLSGCEMRASAEKAADPSISSSHLDSL